MLYRIADEVGATKIALGHHLDDVVETLLLNTFFAGALKAMPARLVSDDGRHIVIRPLVYVQEAEASAYAKESALPVIGCCCPACGDLSLQRQRVKRLIMDLEREHPHVKASMMKALTNVMPRHLLDRRLAAARRLRRPSRPSRPSRRSRAAGRAFAMRADMRAVVQRVRYARVEVDDRVVGSIGPGLLALVGVAARRWPRRRRARRGQAPRPAHLRRRWRRRRPAADESIGGRRRRRRCSSCRSSRWPPIPGAAAGRRSTPRRRPTRRAALYEDVVADLRASGLAVATGEFQAAMRVTLENDGPVTFVLESRPS